ncbi:hypothetical protein [Pseudoalteromonas piscicida]|uniref:Solute-binding protein family 3/N-terminal domain-containing protein n=1 Tax=Pseudoalteromonas piscicida TaxID=43662 RepID=A0A2A5JQS4_PSEO7|nr:hypothetical protein [Pseudoalteromonas piscicida]PCK31812.1 hypothetical protein CEX98_10545 [Pseudoalteromonas piscicida]
MVEVSGTKNSSSLEDLLAANPNWLLGIEKERSYGDKADAIIANTVAEQLYIKEGSENEAQMYSMLMSGRFEVLLEYPSVVAFYGKNGKVKPRIVELNTFSPLITGHIACSDTPATQALLAVLNVELELLRNDSRFIQWHLDYIDKSLHDSFSAEYRKAHQD